MIKKELYILRHRLKAFLKNACFNYPEFAGVYRIMYTFRAYILTGLIVVFTVSAGRYFYIEAKKENHVFNIWYHIHGGSFWPGLWRPPEYILQELEAMKALGGDEKGAVSLYAALILKSYNEHGPYYNRFIGNTIPMDWLADADSTLIHYPKYYREAMAKSRDNPHYKAVARYLMSPEWVSLYIDALERFPKHPYNAMMAYHLAYSSHLSDKEKRQYRELYEELTGRYLLKSRKDRHGYRPFPKFDGAKEFRKEKEGLKVQLTPGEKLALEEIDFYNSDRGKIGLYVRVVDGEVRGVLKTDGEEYGERQDFRQNDANYRFFLCDNPDGVNKVQIVLCAGQDGAEVIIRDYYPMIGNPRFYRTPKEYFFVKPLKKIVGKIFKPYLRIY